jgi:hypothetical protein
MGFSSLASIHAEASCFDFFKSAFKHFVAQDGLERPVREFNSKQIADKTHELVLTHLARDPGFPQEDYENFMAEKFANPEKMPKEDADASLGDALERATGEFIAKTEASREIVRNDAVQSVEEVAKLAEDPTLTCKSLPCSDAEVETLAAKVKNIIKFKCMRDNPIAITNVAKIIALLAGGLAEQQGVSIYHKIGGEEKNESVSKKLLATGAKMEKTFPYDVLLSYSVWFVIMGEVGCRRTLGTVSDPIQETEKRTALGNVTHFVKNTGKFYGKNYPKYAVWTPGIVATSILFGAVQDKVRKIKRPKYYYPNRTAGLLIYEGTVGPFVRMTLDLSFLKALPFVKGKWPASLDKPLGAVTWWPFEYLAVRQPVAAAKSAAYFSWLDFWGKDVNPTLLKEEKKEFGPGPASVAPTVAPPITKTDVVKQMADSISTTIQENKIANEPSH